MNEHTDTPANGAFVVTESDYGNAFGISFDNRGDAEAQRRYFAEIERHVTAADLIVKLRTLADKIERGENVAEQPAPRALPGGRRMWFDPATLPARDKHGYTSHDDLSLRIWFDGEPADEAPLAKQAFEDMELEVYVDCADEFERYDNWNPVTDDFNDAEESGCAKWTPGPPSGDGWRLAAIYDTEDGPTAMWVRERVAT